MGDKLFADLSQIYKSEDVWCDAISLGSPFKAKKFIFITFLTSIFMKSSFGRLFELLILFKP